VAYYLGIDGGGSKTMCAVGDETSLFATATVGPSNITRVGETRAREALHQAIREACATGRIDPQHLKRACVGVAGAGRAQVAGTIRKVVAEIISGEVNVVGDMEIAMSAAFGAGPGVIVIAGTGSIAYGRNAQGQTARAGGWGFAVSDEGSAHWIGRQAVSEVLRAIDQAGLEKGEANPGGLDDKESAAEEIPLYGKLKSGWKVGSCEAFVRFANSGPDFAALLPVIAASAENGDVLANRVLVDAGAELAELAGIVIRQIFAKSCDVPIPLAVVGGVFQNSQIVREAFREDVHKKDSRLEINPHVIEPVTGALQMARNGASAAGK
jgi:N-acetylglucosamine kinase-like BadF-type ATPase